MHISVLNPFSYTQSAATLCCILASGLLFVACTTETQTAAHGDVARVERPMDRTETIPSDQPCIYGQMGRVGMLTDTPTKDYPVEPATQNEEASQELPGSNPLTERLEKLNAQYQQFYIDYMNLLADMQTLAAVKDDVTNIKQGLAGMSVITVEPSPLTNTETVIMDDGLVLRRTISPDPLESSVSAMDRPIDITTLRGPPAVTQEAPPQKAVVVADAEPVKEAPAPEKPKEQTHAPAPVKTTTEPKSVEQSLLNGTFLSAANRVRIGEHPGKKRFVIDFAAGSIIDYKQEQADHNLTVTLGDTAWHGRTTWSSSNSESPIKGYTVETTDSGSVLHITLSDKATVSKVFDMPPESPTDGPKLVIDIAG